MQLVAITASYFRWFVTYLKGSFQISQEELFVGYVKTCTYSPNITHQHDLWYKTFNFRAAASLPLYHLPHIRQRKHYVKKWISITEISNIWNKKCICKTFMSKRKTNTLKKVSDWLLGSGTVVETWSLIDKSKNRNTVSLEGWILKYIPSHKVLNTMPFKLLVSTFEFLTDLLVAQTQFVISHIVYSFHLHWKKCSSSKA